jgi:hypothetical protein
MALAALLHDTDVHRRLVACPRCECRRRGISEVGGDLVGHCLRCGEILESPLEVESLLTARACDERVLRVHAASSPAS